MSNDESGRLLENILSLDLVAPDVPGIFSRSSCRARRDTRNRGGFAQEGLLRAGRQRHFRPELD